MNNLFKRIEVNPDIMFGKPVIKGTRITVEIILQKLADGETKEEILNSYPKLTELDIQSAINYAADLVSREETFLISKT